MSAIAIEAVRKTVTVECTVEEAFRVFTEDATSWWPAATHSIRGELRDVVFEPKVGGEVYEVAADGERGHWATVVAWQPPTRLVLEWNILRRPGEVTEVEVRFAEADGRTRVDLEHRGWENVDVDAGAKRSSYETGWDHVLGFYVERLA